jgi:hypothetical protein
MPYLTPLTGRKCTIVVRKLKFCGVTIAVAWISLCSSSYALSLQDTLRAWPAASDAERYTVARLLAVVASQGLPQLDEEFFESCISFASMQTLLQSKKISEVGAMCVDMHMRISTRDLRP